jgi:hypothetical protein
VWSHGRFLPRPLAVGIERVTRREARGDLSRGRGANFSVGRRTVEDTVDSGQRACTALILLKRGPAPPPVYQSQYDPKELFNVLKVFVCQ